MLRRSSVSQTNFLAGWRSGLTYLRSTQKRPMVLRCLDETGVDWMGADEISLKLRADSMLPFFIEKEWNDADTDEMLMLAEPMPALAFVDKIEIWVNEADFIQSDATITSIPALGAGDAPTKEVLHEFGVQSGTYRFECTLSRRPD